MFDDHAADIKKVAEAMSQHLKHTEISIGALRAADEPKPEHLVNLAVQAAALRHGVSVAETGNLECHLLNFVEGVG